MSSATVRLKVDITTEKATGLYIAAVVSLPLDPTNVHPQLHLHPRLEVWNAMSITNQGLHQTQRQPIRNFLPPSPSCSAPDVTCQKAPSSTEQNDQRGTTQEGRKRNQTHHQASTPSSSATWYPSRASCPPPPPPHPPSRRRAEHPAACSQQPATLPQRQVPTPPPPMMQDSHSHPHHQPARALSCVPAASSHYYRWKRWQSPAC